MGALKYWSTKIQQDDKRYASSAYVTALMRGEFKGTYSEYLAAISGKLTGQDCAYLKGITL